MKANILPLLTFTMFVITVHAQIPTKGLVAWYPFNGNATDSSGNGNNPSFNNAQLTTDRFGKPNSAYLFDGKSNYIQVPNSPTLNFDTSLSVCNWVRVIGFYQGNCHANYMVGKGLGNNNFVCDFYDGAYTNNAQCNGSLPDTAHESFAWVGCFSGANGPFVKEGVWYFSVITYDGNTAKYYLNGSLVATSVFNRVFTNPYDLFFGRNDISSTNAPYWLNGTLDDIRIYNRSLDSTEITTLYNEGTPLPIKILSVEAAIKNSDVNISWQSANELNTTDIIVQRSTDGTDFIEIGKLKAIGSGSNGYQFTDKNPSKGLNYYRLQSFDKDGTFTFSKVVSAYFGKKPLFSIAPNPARDITTINFNKTNDKANVTVYDLKGKVVISKSIIDANSNVYKLNTQPLTNGIYIIKVNTSTDSYNEKLLINK